MIECGLLWVEWGWRAYPLFLIKSYSTVTVYVRRHWKREWKRERKKLTVFYTILANVMFARSIIYRCIQNGGPVSLWAAGVICPNLISSRHLHIVGLAELWSSRHPCSNTEQHANPYDITTVSSSFCLAWLWKRRVNSTLKNLCW